MATIAEIIEAAKRCCRKSVDGDSQANRRYDDLFGGEWEVFVVKFDERTGEFRSRLACCAASPV